MNPLLLLLALLLPAGMLSSGSSSDTDTPPDPDPLDDETGGEIEGSDDETDDETGNETDDETEVVNEPVNPTPEPPEQTGGTGENGGDVADTPLTGDAIAVISGRVATLQPAGDDVASVRIVDGPGAGHVSVNPDNTLALVMTLDRSFTGDLNFTYEVTHADGSTSLHRADVVVEKGPQDGWATSESHYMLETDADGNVIVEHGDIHRPVYVSGSEDALTAADIAALENIDPSRITATWLANNPEYGGSEGMALSQELGEILWAKISGNWSNTSNWLLLERGYEYDWSNQLVGVRTSGESELHPLYFGSWGEGEKPVITTEQDIFHVSSKHIVFQGITLTGGLDLLNASNIILDDVSFVGSNLNVQYSTGITVHNSDFLDLYMATAPSWLEGDYWKVGTPRSTGLYSKEVDGLRIDGNYFDQIGWSPDYRYDMSTEGGQPPNWFSHGMYIQRDNSDVMLTDTIVMRSASTGVQFRAGGYVEGNLILDNNIGITVGFGDPVGDGTYTGNYTFFSDNVITSAAYLTVKEGLGNLSMGIDQQGILATYVDNIVAHLADPNNPEELTWKIKTDNAFNELAETFYDDTIIWNWQAATTRSQLSGWRDQNVDGLDQAVLDKTTIQEFTALLLGDPDATIDDLSAYLRAQANGALDNVVDAELIVRFFQLGFGIAPDIRTEAGLIRFVPNDLGDGVRWDNGLNWSTGDLPGSVAGDSVDLGGNKVVFGGTETVAELEFGPNGGLIVNHGKLTVTEGLETGTEGATVDIDGAGQLWIEGARGEGLLDIDVVGGRLVNTGLFQANSDLTASGGQTILAADDATWAVTDGSRLEVAGGGGEIGFDGDEGGIAILGLADDGTLAFTAEDGTLGTIEEFRSGAFGDEVNVQSGADLGGSTLEIDLSGLSSGTDFTLLDVDELIGAFGETNLLGLGSRDAEIVIDYENDAVRLVLKAGTGLVKTTTIGTADLVSAGDEALWEALTAGQGTYDEALPAIDDEDYLFAAA